MQDLTVVWHDRILNASHNPILWRRSVRCTAWYLFIHAPPKIWQI